MCYYLISDMLSREPLKNAICSDFTRKLLNVFIHTFSSLSRSSPSQLIVFQKFPGKSLRRAWLRGGVGAARRGFTVAELLVSIGVLIIISVSVVRDITRTRYQEELTSSARMVVSTLRDIQSRALAASSIKTCIPSAGVTAVCEVSLSSCGTSACNQTVSPTVFGATFQNGSSQFSTFADVNGISNLREDLSGLERIQMNVFPKSNPSSSYVTITSLLADSLTITSSTVTFDRQRGSMRINACLSGSCTPAEAVILSVTLTHSKTAKTKVIYLNAVTGKIEIQ